MGSKFRPLMSCCDRLMDYCWHSGQYIRTEQGKRKLLYTGYWMFKCYICSREITV